jgi:hypothetical protein
MFELNERHDGAICAPRPVKAGLSLPSPHSPMKPVKFMFPFSFSCPQTFLSSMLEPASP